MPRTHTTLMIVAVLGLLGACGGGGGDDTSGFVPLDHNPLPEVPRGPDLSDDDDGSGGGRPPQPKIPLLELETFQRASAVIGQPDFQGQSPNQGIGTAADTLDLGGGIAESGGAVYGDLWIADAFNNRVLRYERPLTGNGPDAEISLGQVDMTSAHFGTTERDLHWPVDVAVSGDKLFVSDQTNNRVLIFDGLPATTGAQAQVVVGQPDMFTKDARATRKGLYGPHGICVTGNKLLVADARNNRVLIWNYIPTGNDASASLVLGQQDFISNKPATSATGFDQPSAVWSDGTKLLVADTGNNRILVWDAFPTRNGQAADRVLGAPNFTGRVDGTSSGVGWPHPGAHVDVILTPADVVSNGTQIVVADAGTNRVLIWSTWPLFNHERPRIVLGQRAFDRGGPNDDDQNGLKDATPSDRTLSLPTDVMIVGKRLYVTDRDNHRVLVFE
ncbi:MAG: NHL repeat-containing protein [Planctomycetota bacterium]|nr:NHL repeat-containing protein [Planctomycetota bacterium]